MCYHKRDLEVVPPVPFYKESDDRLSGVGCENFASSIRIITLFDPVTYAGLTEFGWPCSLLNAQPNYCNVCTLPICSRERTP